MTSNIRSSIIEILKLTKDDGELKETCKLNDEVSELLGIMSNEKISIRIDRTHRITLAKRAIQLGANLSDIIELLTWKDFEGFVASILIENNYECVESFRRRGNSLIQGMEIDVIGVRGNTIVAIDAKMWGIRTGKTSALKMAAEKQKDRTQELKTELNNLSKRVRMLKEGKYQLIPVIVTWLVEEVEFHEGVPVVPIFKFNSFILDIDQYEDLIVTYTGHHHITSN
ncbi:MAG: hypothetical protein ACFFDQ_00880 [Candidatus Thorarchaeota archaeon]